MQARRRFAAALAATVLAVVLAGALALALTWPDRRAPVVERCLASVDGTTYDLAPYQAAYAATITAVAVRRGLPARAATIAIATATQESKLRNVDHGDRDSLGLFQQRPSQGWGSPDQLMDPIYATNAFYDALVEVHGYQTMEVTQASHRVQRSAFPEAVADHEATGRAFASALAGHSPAALTCRLRPPDEPGDVSAVQRLLARDLGDAQGSVEGQSLRLAVGSDEAGRRRAWVLASWAVAHAQGLDVVRVSADGRRWSRDAPGDGWAPAPGGTTEGAVVVEVAPSP